MISADLLQLGSDSRCEALFRSSPLFFNPPTHTITSMSYRISCMTFYYSPDTYKPSPLDSMQIRTFSEIKI